jgi:hypothetical protein
VFEAEAQHVPVWIVLALQHRESGGDAHARSRIDGISLGRMQLNPRSKWGQAWLAECQLTPSDCAQANMHWGVRALRDGYDECGTWLRAVTFYRSGRCKAKHEVVEGSHRVMELAGRLYFEHGAQVRP